MAGVLEIEKIEARGHDRTIWSTPLTPTWRAGVLACWRRKGMHTRNGCKDNDDETGH